jgi:general stress protein 26
LISTELASFLESGVSMQVGTRDARLLPEAVRGMGVRAERGGTRLTVFLPAATAERTLANLRDNGRIAVCFSRPEDHRTIQVKGRAVAVREADAAERALVERYRGSFAQSLLFVGVPLRVSLRAAHWPCRAVELEVEEVFQQTPGPGAGAPLEGGGRAA